MQNLLTELIDTLKSSNSLVVDGKLVKNKVVEMALSFDSDLLKLLIGNESIKKHFFQDVEGVLIFDKIEFQKFVSNKQFLPDSYTAFKNKIGLAARGEYLTEAGEVELVWPYKDCVLEGGQRRDSEKRHEIFWNQTLAINEIDRLFTPKVLTTFKLHTLGQISPAESACKDDNYIIKGNNLLTLHSLLSVYRNEVKLIYIDPPYNTGKDSFKYNDSFNHSTWLTFMKNRLEVAQKLLKPDGVIFISIDMNEHAYLKVLCDELFGRGNFLGDIVWETATDNNATQISCEHEYVIAYAKDRSLQGKWYIMSEKGRHIQKKHDELKEAYSSDTVKIETELRAWIRSMKKSNELDLSGVSHYAYVDEKGVFYPGNSANTYPGDYRYDILHPITKAVCKKPDNGYRWPESTFWDAEARGDVLWGPDEKSIPHIKKRLESATELLKGYFYEDNRKSTKALSALMGGKVFDNPKSINLLKKIIRFASSDRDIVLDFFAGSGSTAQALLEINREDNINRQFILCEQMEYVDTVTIPRVSKCLGDENFISCELFPVNESFLIEIEKANTHKELSSILDQIFDKGFVNWHVDRDELKSNKLNQLKLPELKNVLRSILDFNDWYLPLSEIEDNDFSISSTNKTLNKRFYNK